MMFGSRQRLYCINNTPGITTAGSGDSVQFTETLKLTGERDS